MKRSLIFGVPSAAVLAAVVLGATVLGVALAASGGSVRHNDYVRRNLVSDQAGKAAHVDPNLVNAWGLVSLADSPWWVADNGTNRTTVYTPNGTAFAPSGSPLVVSIRNAPTGAVANTGSSFVVRAGRASSPAMFLFATEKGKILGWNRAIPPSGAVLAADRSRAGAIYKGLAISGRRLYASDFHNGHVDVFNGSFKRIRKSGAFVDRMLPRGFAPFGIQTVGGRIFVTYAKQDPKREDNVDGRGLGFVDAFDRNGKLLARVARRGQLNAPWGIARAPGNFGRFSGDLLIGNFGDGTINAYKQRSGRTYTYVGQLRTGKGKPLVIDGLWALQFGHGTANNGPANTLFFTAGPNDEAHGLFGTVTAR